jgi:hypothetical protein
MILEQFHLPVKDHIINQQHSNSGINLLAKDE